MSPEACLEAYETASREHDLERVLALVDPEAVYWFSNGTCHVGKDAVAAAIRANFEAIEAEDYRLVDPVWIAKSEDTAVCTYRFEWAGVIQGQSMSGAGRGTCVWARRDTGWRITHEHLSQGPAS
ncbi:MAG: DUF4440 domain-containing protein [Planctomycetota bacterium]